jgi:hypothetical protein
MYLTAIRDSVNLQLILLQLDSDVLLSIDKEDRSKATSSNSLHANLLLLPLAVCQQLP